MITILAFIVGVFVGLAIAAVIFAILAFFRTAIEHKIKIIEKQLGSAGPRPQGAIFMPEDEADIVRREHIKKNRERGLDTPISELR